MLFRLFLHMSPQNQLRKAVDLSEQLVSVGCQQAHWKLPAPNLREPQKSHGLGAALT